MPYAPFPFCTALGNNITGQGEKLLPKPNRGNKSKISFCNFSWGGDSLDHTAQKRETAGIPHRNDHLKRIRLQVRKLALCPVLWDAVIRNGAVYSTVPLSCAKIEPESDERKRSLFGHPAFALGALFPSALLADRGAGLARVCRSGRFGPTGPNRTTVAKLATR